MRTQEEQQKYQPEAPLESNQGQGEDASTRSSSRLLRARRASAVVLAVLSPAASYFWSTYASLAPPAQVILAGINASQECPLRTLFNLENASGVYCVSFSGWVRPSYSDPYPLPGEACENFNKNNTSYLLNPTNLYLHCSENNDEGTAPKLGNDDKVNGVDYPCKTCEVRAMYTPGSIECDPCICLPADEAADSIENIEFSDLRSAIFTITAVWALSFTVYHVLEAASHGRSGWAELVKSDVLELTGTLILVSNLLYQPSVRTITPSNGVYQLNSYDKEVAKINSAQWGIIAKSFSVSAEGIMPAVTYYTEKNSSVNNHHERAWAAKSRCGSIVSALAFTVLVSGLLVELVVMMVFGSNAGECTADNTWVIPAGIMASVVLAAVVLPLGWVWSLLRGVVRRNGLQYLVAAVRMLSISQFNLVAAAYAGSLSQIMTWSLTGLSDVNILFTRWFEGVKALQEIGAAV